MDLECFSVDWIALLPTVATQIKEVKMSSEVEEGHTGDFPFVVELNVGGVYYTTSLTTLTREKDSLLGQIFTGTVKDKIIKDTKGKYFLDRDGVLFRYILDYLRNQRLVLPENFQEMDRLKEEANYFKLPSMVTAIAKIGTSYLPAILSNHTGNISPSPNIENREPGCIIVGYRGTFAFGRDGLADVKFRKPFRILVSGRVSLCREAFGDTLNESRDPDRGTADRYSCRFFLKHAFIEQAFEMLIEIGYKMVGSCGSGTNSAGELKPGMETEEDRWQHYNEFVFMRLRSH